jgi:hypothetical protein
MSGCATYSGTFRKTEHDLAAQKYDAALSDLKSDSSSKDRVLYYLNKGMILRMERNFTASNIAFELAKKDIDSLYATSVTESVLSVTVNDTTVSYSGADYERMLLHSYMSLNYLELGQPDSARVESLQIDEALRSYKEKHPGTKFSDDAFALYLTGMIYEDMGEYSDAMISYRSAYTAYKHTPGGVIPLELQTDLLRMSQQQGLTNELQQYETEFNAAPSVHSEQGELVFILSNGLVSMKHERSMIVPALNSGTLVRISLPFYREALNGNNVASARITVGNQQSTTELVDNIDSVARKNLDEHMPAIIARSAARAVVKTEAVSVVERNAMNNGGNNSSFDILGALALQVAAIATEQADTRSWLTLPSNIQMARLQLPAGKHTVTIDFLDRNQNVVSTRNEEVTITERKTFLTKHWIP